MDINPRVGAAYDLFGNGRTALKFAIGRYVAKTNVDVPAANNPITTSVITTSRAWRDLNKNFVPDCDLGNFGEQPECGAIDNQFFGQNNPRAVQWTDGVLHGWGARDSNWDLSSEIQHQLLQGLSVTGGYYFNTGGYFRNSATLSKNRDTDNTLVGPDDFEPFCITAPTNPELPGGGGYPVCGMYNIKQDKFGQRQDTVALASNYGVPEYRNHFFNFTLDARLPGGARFGGGVDTGFSVRDTCYIVDSPQEMLYCRVTTPVKANTQIKFNGSYPMRYRHRPGGHLPEPRGSVVRRQLPRLLPGSGAIARPASGRRHPFGHCPARRAEHALRGPDDPPRSPRQQDLQHGDVSPAAQPGRLQRAQQQFHPVREQHLRRAVAAAELGDRSAVVPGEWTDQLLTRTGVGEFGS